LKPGDELEVLGFPAYNSPPPMLEDAIFERPEPISRPNPSFWPARQRRLIMKTI